MIKKTNIFFTILLVTNGLELSFFGKRGNVYRVEKHATVPFPEFPLSIHTVEPSTNGVQRCVTPNNSVTGFFQVRILPTQ